MPPDTVTKMFWCKAGIHIFPSTQKSKQRNLEWDTKTQPNRIKWMCWWRWLPFYSNWEPRWHVVCKCRVETLEINNLWSIPALPLPLPHSLFTVNATNHFCKNNHKLRFHCVLVKMQCSAFPNSSLQLILAFKTLHLPLIYPGHMNSCPLPSPVIGVFVNRCLSSQL